MHLDYSIHMAAYGHLYRIVYLLKATNAYLFDDLFVEMLLLCCSLASAIQMDSRGSVTCKCSIYISWQAASRTFLQMGGKVHIC